MLTDLIGLQRPAYRAQIVSAHTVSQEEAQRNWTTLTCTQLLDAPPHDLLDLIQKRLIGSAKNALNHRLHNGGSSTGGPRGHMECRGYGPCIVFGVPESERAVDMLFDGDKCAKITPSDVMHRVCGAMAIDERLYLEARRAFEGRIAASGSVTHARLGLLRDAGAELAARAQEQSTQPVRALEQASGTKLERAYQSSSGQGVPWKADETQSSYVAHERARYSCVGCSGDVVPEKDLLGCWPLWTQFAPDELTYRCNRSWSSDPGLQEPQRYKRGAPMPCWRTCWTPMKMAAQGNERSQAHCTAPCPTSLQPAIEWRQQWDRALAAFLASSDEGRQWHKSMRFAHPPIPLHSFIWNVY